MKGNSKLTLDAYMEPSEDRVEIHYYEVSAGDECIGGWGQ